MKVLLTALNSQFVHASLSIRTLQAAVEKRTGGELVLKEYTINQDEDYILRDLAAEKADLVAFSCYIWNIEAVRRLARNLKKIDPQTDILYGGPEITPDRGRKFFPEADWLLAGEGEEAFGDFLRAFEAGFPDGPDEFDGAAGVHIVEALDSLAFPYTEEALEAAEGRILYYESSRGCPFRCSYCLSSTIKKTRHKSLEKVLPELDRFLARKVRQVKFVDRTFNTDRPRAVAILEHLIRHDNGVTNFHFEINGDRLDDAFIDAVARSRKGLFQFEIGVQSTCPETLQAVRRKTDLAKLGREVGRLLAADKSHIHLDLIAGLPHEDYDRFARSFNQVWAMKGHHLQLGFLKLLPGTEIRRDAQRYSYAFKSEPPYEVLKTHVLSHGELSRLKEIEDVLERFGNSGAFEKSVEHLVGLFGGDAFAMYEALAAHLARSGFFKQAHSKKKLYGWLYGFRKTLGRKDALPLFRDLLKFDCLRHSPGALPGFLEAPQTKAHRDRCHRFLQEASEKGDLPPAYRGMPAKQIIKRVRIEAFDHDPATEKKQPCHLLFDYGGERGFKGEHPFIGVTLPN